MTKQVDINRSRYGITGPTPAANNLPDDRISIADKDFAHITGFLTSMFTIDVPSFILSVIAATADNVHSESNQMVLKTMWSIYTQ